VQTQPEITSLTANPTNLAVGMSAAGKKMQKTPPPNLKPLLDLPLFQ
jgi:hypothetical protein